MLPQRTVDFPMPSQSRAPLLDAEFIGFFTRVATVLGVPKSVGEIYGLLFAAQNPLSFEEIAQQTGLSAGSVSYGLRFLRGVGAVKLNYIQGDRRDHYVAETRLNRLAAGLLREKIEFIDGNGNLQRIAEMVQNISDAERCQHFVERSGLLSEWHRAAVEFTSRLLEASDSDGEERGNQKAE